MLTSEMLDDLASAGRLMFGLDERLPGMYRAMLILEAGDEKADGGMDALAFQSVKAHSIAALTDLHAQLMNSSWKAFRA